MVDSSVEESADRLSAGQTAWLLSCGMLEDLVMSIGQKDNDKRKDDAAAYAGEDLLEDLVRSLELEELPSRLPPSRASTLDSEDATPEPEGRRNTGSGELADLSFLYGGGGGGLDILDRDLGLLARNIIEMEEDG